MTKISVAEVGYIAGLFDGEGSLHIRRGMEKKKKHKGGFKYSRIANSRRSLRMTRRKSLRHKKHHKKHKRTKKHRRRKRR